VRESAGKRQRPEQQHGNKWLTAMLVSAYYMLSLDEPYRDLGPDWLSRRNDEAHARRLVAQLERLGHTVILDPVA
jgi:transposase